MKKEFTAEAGKALNRAAKYAAKMGQYVVGSEHLLYGLGSAPGDRKSTRLNSSHA